MARESASVAAARAHQHAPGEAARIERVGRLDLTGASRRDLDVVAQRAAALMGTAMGAVTLVVHDDHLTIAAHGCSDEVTARETSLCTHVVARGEPMVACDLVRDPFFALNPRVGSREGELRAYCGVPIRDRDGTVLGVLCVVDDRPRAFTGRQVAALSQLATVALAVLVPYAGPLPAPAPAAVPVPALAGPPEDPMSRWIDRVVPSDDDIDELLARRRGRSWWWSGTNRRVA